MARSLSIIWHEEADQLEALYKSEKEPQRRTRLACALVSALRPYRPIGGPSGAASMSGRSNSGWPGIGRAG